MNADSVAPEKKLAFISLKKKLAAGRSPANLFLSLTDSCDLRCRHCRYRHRRAKGRMPLSLAKKSLLEAERNGIPQVTFFGGEPSLYPGLREVSALAEKLGLFSELDTNAQSLKGGDLSKLSRAGLSSLMISLHSEDPEEHDRLTGRKGSHAKAVSILRKALKAGLLCYVSACFFKSNYSREKLAGFARFARRLGAHGIRSLFFCGRLTAPSQPAAMARDIKALGLENYARGCFSYDPRGKRCAGGLGRLLHVDSAGKVRVCPYSRRQIGDISSESLSLILKRARGHKRTSPMPCK